MRFWTQSQQGAAVAPRRTAGTAALLALALLAGCDAQAPPQGKPPGGGMPPAQVGVVTVTPQPVGLTTELPGRLEASRVAQVVRNAAEKAAHNRFLPTTDRTE